MAAVIFSSVACAYAEGQPQPEQSAPTIDALQDASKEIADAVLVSTAIPPSTNTPTATPAPTATRMPTSTPTPKPTTTPEPPPTATVIPSPTRTATPPAPIVTIGGTTFDAEIADTPELRSKGLGERDSLSERSGMLFVFPSGQASSFWMKGMRFPLDFVWIGANCTVVDVTEDVRHSPPDTPNSELDTFAASSPAAYTFEINAGEISRFSIEIGDEVRFYNIESDFTECCETGVCDGN